MKKFLVLAAMLLVAYSVKVGDNAPTLQSTTTPVNGEQQQVEVQNTEAATASESSKPGEMKPGSSETLNWKDVSSINQINTAEAATPAQVEGAKPKVSVIARKAARTATKASTGSKAQTDIKTADKTPAAPTTGAKKGANIPEKLKVIPRNKNIRIVTHILGDEDCKKDDEPTTIHHIHHHHHHHYIHNVQSQEKEETPAKWEHADTQDADEDQCDNNADKKEVHHIHVTIQKKRKPQRQCGCKKKQTVHHIVVHQESCNKCKEQDDEEEEEDAPKEIHHHIHHVHVHNANAVEQHSRWFDLKPKTQQCDGHVVIHHHHHHVVIHAPQKKVQHEECKDKVQHVVIVHHEGEEGSCKKKNKKKKRCGCKRNAVADDIASILD